MPPGQGLPQARGEPRAAPASCLRVRCLRLCLCAIGPLTCSGISQLFVEYDYGGDGRQRFGLSLGLFVDCLNIFSSPGHASAVEIRYPGPDMQLLLKYVCVLSGADVLLVYGNGAQTRMWRNLS